MYWNVRRVDPQADGHVCQPIQSSNQRAEGRRVEFARGRPVDSWGGVLVPLAEGEGSIVFISISSWGSVVIDPLSFARASDSLRLYLLKDSLPRLEDTSGQKFQKAGPPASHKGLQGRVVAG